MLFSKLLYLSPGYFSKCISCDKAVIKFHISDIPTKNTVKFHVKSLPILSDMYFTSQSTSSFYARKRILCRSYRRVKSEALGHVMEILVGLGTNFL